jgi:predicted fused transcriptional regulator/phosphomethylpyrimidine kinase
MDKNKSSKVNPCNPCKISVPNVVTNIANLRDPEETLQRITAFGIIRG